MSWQAFETFIHGVASVDLLPNAVAAALLAGLISWRIADHFTRRIKRAEFMMANSVRFQDLLHARFGLNKTVFVPHAGLKRGQIRRTRREGERADAWNWFRQLFSLMQADFEFFRQGLVTVETYTEWVAFRRFDYLQQPKDEPDTTQQESGLTTGGITYREAWEWWSRRPQVCDGRFVKFLNKVHDPKTVSLRRLVAGVRMWRWLVGLCTLGFAD